GLLRAPEVKERAVDAASSRVGGFVVGEEETRGIGADVARDFDVDAYRRLADRGGAVRSAMRVRHVRAVRAAAAQLLLRDAAEHPLVAPLRARKPVGDRELLGVAPRARIGDLRENARAKRPRLRQGHDSSGT